MEESMKKDYCRILRRGGFLLVALTFCLLTACSNLWKEEISDNTENQKQSGELAYITLGNAGFSQAGARDIFPSADDLDKYNLQNVSLTGIWGLEREARTIIAEKEDWSAFYNWLYVEELIRHNPMAKVEQIKVIKGKKKAFSDLELEQIRNACTTAREKAMTEKKTMFKWCRKSE